MEFELYKLQSLIACANYLDCAPKNFENTTSEEDLLKAFQAGEKPDDLAVEHWEPY